MPKRVLFIGGYGHFYLLGAVRDGQAEAIGWASDGVDAAASRRAAERRPASPVVYHDDALRAMDELAPDVVNIGAVYAHNGRLVIEALTRGIPVVSDKPIAADEATYERIAGLCGESGCPPLITEFDLRAAPGFRAARVVMERGLVGRAVLCVAQKSYRFGQRPDFYKDRDQYTGTLMWVASHGIDLIHYTTGERFASVTGTSGNLAHREYASVEDHVVACYELAGGGSAVVHADYLRPRAAPTHGDDRLRIAGSTGLIEVRDGRCMVSTHEQGPTDMTDLGSGAKVSDDLLGALDGCTDVYGTGASLYTARVLLDSREAVDRRARRAIPRPG